MNLANKLTLSRLVLVPFFLIFTIQDNVYTRIAALLVFGVGSLGSGKGRCGVCAPHRSWKTYSDGDD